MLDLVWKDVVAGRRAFSVVISLGVLQLAVTGSVGPVFLPTAFLFSGVFAFSPVFLEETQHTEILWNSLPVTRGRIVAARYLSVVLGILVGLGLSWAVGQVVTRLMRSGAGGPAGAGDLHAMALLFVVLMLAAALFLPFYFRWGLGRGGVIFSVVGAAATLLAAVLVQVVLAVKGYSDPIFDPETLRKVSRQVAEWLMPRWGRVLSLLMGFSACAMAVSLLVSWWLYETRDL